MFVAVLLLSAIRWADAAEGAPATAEPAPPVVSAPQAAPGVVIDRVAVVVNEEIITLSELYAFGQTYIDQVVAAQGPGARSAAEREVLDRLLERRLVEQEMRDLKLDVNEQDVDRSIGQIAERNGLDADGLRKEIEKNGMAWDQYRSELKESLRDMKFAQSVLRPRINITEDELRDAWLRTNPAVTSSARVQALMLEIPANATPAERDALIARAQKIRAEANAGADFGALSKANDQGPFGEHDGEMGVFKPGELVEALDQVITSSPVGEVSEPIVLGNGVYLLRVAERTSGGSDFEAQRDQVSEQVFQSRLEDEKQRWFQEARRKASIRILLPGAAEPAAATPPAP